MVPTEVSISLDGNAVGNFSSTQVQLFDILEYNFPIFSMDGIPSGDHTVTVQTVDADVQTITVLFDYVLYT